MRIFRAFRISSFAILILMLNVSASFGFSASASLERTRISLGETVRLTVSTSDNVSDLDADTSGIVDFDVLSRSSSSMTQIVNGNMSVNISMVMELSPKRTGTLKIPALKVTAEGDTAYTKPIDVEVSEDKSSSSGTGANEDVFAESRLSNDKVYMGETVLYTFCLYFREQISSPNLTLPDFRDFSATEIKSPSSYTKTINGVPYNVLEKNVLLTPQKPGKFNFDPALLVFAASAGVRRDFFGFPEAVMQKRSLRTGTNSIEVRSLPAIPEGLSYSGFVGDLSVKMKMEPKELKTGDSATLSIEFEGKGGRVGDIGRPEIKIPDSFKVYQDEPELKEDNGAQGFSGKKTFKMAIVPTKPGAFVLEPLKITYFDSAQGSYKTIETESIHINVSMGEKSQAVLPSGKSQEEKGGDVKKSPEVSGNDIFHIKTSLDTLRGESQISFLWFMVLFFIPPLIFCVAIFAGKLMLKSKTLSARLKAESLDSLKRASCVSDPGELLTLIHRAMASAVASRTDGGYEFLTSLEISTKLENLSFDSGFVKEYSNFFAEIEMLRFGGTGLSPDRMNEIKALADSLIRKVI